MSDYEYEYKSFNEGENVVDGFKQRERVGFKRGMMTEIEGHGVYAKAQKRKEKRDEDFKIISQIENYCYTLQEYYKFDGEEFDIIIDMFRSLPRKEYKNPYAFVLGYILYLNMSNTKEIKKTFSTIQELLNIQEGLTIIDVIRYSRLIQIIKTE